MAVIRSAGGPSGRGAYRQTWQGATVLRAWEGDIQAGLEAEAVEIKADLQSSLHKVTGRNAASAFARVEVRGGKRTLTLGADMPYSIFEEIRHPIIRAIADAHIPHVTQKIRAASGRGR